MAVRSEIVTICCLPYGPLPEMPPVKLHKSSTMPFWLIFRTGAWRSLHLGEERAGTRTTASRGQRIAKGSHRICVGRPERRRTRTRDDPSTSLERQAVHFLLHQAAPPNFGACWGFCCPMNLSLLSSGTIPSLQQ